MSKRTLDAETLTADEVATLLKVDGATVTRPVLRCLALASLRRWPGTRWFVWVPGGPRRWWIVSTRQAPMVTFNRTEEKRA